MSKNAALSRFRHLHRTGGDPAAPVLLLLHGTGGDEHDLLELGRSLSPGSTLLSPRGNVLESGMPRFFRRLAEGVFDLEDLKLRTAELADFVQESRVTYQLAGQPIVALGFSNGANIASSLLLSRSDVLSGAILLRATVPFEPSVLPNLSGTKILLAQGQADPYAPVAKTHRLVELFEQSGAQVALHWSPGGHQLLPGDIQAAKTWLLNFRNEAK
jgi:phospholipase/carboxylesterase